MSGTDLRIQKTYAALTREFTALLKEKRFEQITVKEICAQAGVNRSTFYLHYADQTALLSDVEEEVQQKTLEYLRNTKPTDDAPSLIEAFLRYIQEHAGLFRILLCDTGSEDFRGRFIQNTLESLRLNIPMSCSPEEEPYVLCFLMQGSVHMIMEWIRRDFDIDAKQLACLIYQACNRVAPSHLNANVYTINR